MWTMTCWTDLKIYCFGHKALQALTPHRLYLQEPPVHSSSLSSKSKYAKVLIYPARGNSWHHK